MKIRTHCQHGLSLIDVLLVLAALALLASLLLPSSTTCKAPATRIACVNNLKQTGLAYRMWANDHDGQFPQASVNTSGTLAFAQSPEVFRHYLAMSNELVTPKVLVCPIDKKRTKAENFGRFSNANLSYLAGLDAYERYPNGLLSGDRNIIGGTLSNGFLRTLTTNSVADWTESIHKRAGNIGLADGSVQQFTPSRLRQHLAALKNEQTRLAIP